MGLFNKKKNLEEELLETFIEGVKSANENRETIDNEIFNRQEPNLNNFGLCESNPIFTTSLAGTEDYLSRLRTKNGEKFTWSSYRSNRATVHGYENIGEDVYTLYLNGEKYTDIYVVPYVGESIFPPANLCFCDDDTDWDLEREAFEKGITGAQLIEIRKIEEKEFECAKSSCVGENPQEVSQSIAMDKIDINMVCPKCNVNVPDDSVFCPNCGCDIEKEKKQTLTEQEAKPEIKVVEKVVEKVVIKKNKTNKFLVVFLILSFIASSVLGYFTFTYYQQSENYAQEVKDLTNSNKILMDLYNETSVARDALITLKSSENWGYATENFHTDTGILVLTKYSDGKDITMYSTYGGATFSMDISNPDVASAVWTEEAWYDNNTIIRVKPIKSGISVLTITNSKYDNEVNILVIVT